MNIRERWENGFNGGELKMMAAFAMLADHTAFLFLGEMTMEIETVPEKYRYLYLAMRGFGRIAFPIFAFLLTQGFIYTRSLLRYGLRLGIFAVLAEPCFDFMVFGRLWDMQMQNVMITLLLGLILLELTERLGESAGDRSRMILQLGVILLFSIAAWLLQTDYSYIGVMLIAMLYWFRYDRRKMCLIGFIWMSLFCGHWTEIFGYALTFFLISRYNEKKGRGGIGFYLFYPLHMALLGICYAVFI